MTDMCWTELIRKVRTVVCLGVHLCNGLPLHVVSEGVVGIATATVFWFGEPKKKLLFISFSLLLQVFSLKIN